MLKFIRGKGQHPTVERQKLQKELFAFRKTVQHGFPHKPSALAYDAKRSLMAIGTNSGVIKVFGQPGVEFYGQHTSITGNAVECVVQQLEWVPGTGRILSLTAANQLILWEPAGTLLVPIKSLAFDGKLKKISSICCSVQKDVAWLGTEGGDVYQFDLKTFEMKEPIVYHDVVLEQLPTSYKLNPGAIESVKQLPCNPNNLLIAYNRGLCVLWDLENSRQEKAYVSPGHGESVGIYVEPDGEKFTWFHADGSYATWNIDSTDPPEDQKYVPYGPDPCKAINQLYRGFRGDDEMIVFAGGMPRSAFGDRQCVSVHCADGTKVAFDFTSKVIDFFVTYKDEESDEVDVLIVLLEEDLVAYDLTDKTYAQMTIPYLHSLHASAVTCNHLVSQVTAEVYEKVQQAGRQQLINFSTSEWPITGGHVPERDDDDSKQEFEVLLTGHEDGSVKFWDCTGVVLKPLLHVKTASLFGSGGDSEFDNLNDNDVALDDGEPPFRKAGQFDPYSDDPRLAVKKLAFCPKTGILTVAGTAGNVVVASLDIPLEKEDQELPLKVTTMNLVSDRDGFVWKGHDQLKVKPSLLNTENLAAEGVQILSVLQVLPPAAVTCIALQSKWNLVAAGTAHGLVLFDYQNNQPVLHKCTLNPNDLTGAGETLSRRKSFKKTLRESFRRLRKGRSTRNNPAATNPTPAETRPVERQIEARAVDDGMGSMIRCLTFAQTYVTNMHTAIPTLWSGTNSSCVSIFVLHIPPKITHEQSTGDVAAPQPPRSITGQLAKEIQIKHRAPVIGISVFDNAGVPLDFQDGPGASPHKVLIASEEQFKVFSLPQLKPVTKYKLTAHEGARVRRVSFATFSCKTPIETIQTGGKHPKVTTPAAIQATPDTANDTVVADPNIGVHTETALLCLTNLGDCLVLSVPELKRQLNAAAIRREDINGISSLCFTNYGEALYMMSSSELQRITVSAKKIVSPEGFVDLEPLDTEQDDQVVAEDDDDDQKTENIEEEVEENTLEETTPLTAFSNAFNNATKTTACKIHPTLNASPLDSLTNGLDTSGNKANETITSSIGDITIDSVRDHLNTTSSTLHSQITEEIVGRLSVLSTQTNKVVSTVNAKDVLSFNSSDFNDLKQYGADTDEFNTSSVVIKSVITTVTHGEDGDASSTTKTTTTTNGESAKPTAENLSTIITRKESQF